ncbi:nucleotidyltransferase family protein [Dolichospermum sp. UHCC 0259]|uniref:nucleotidyltransferase family protein n=1 Tax=Dolichospermum sp. UHCC 0259 TaxID=2590010 RepID=UPI001446F61C|nr:nucleotidyltransferase family protein [Dolichospermum sp. UHCC 0259]MTJ50063.1 nucleotidyltransferase family protein [Dolichospermum sp. UHCC 0259]
MTIAPPDLVFPASHPSGDTPSKMHKSLLQAAILPEQTALNAWRKWRDSVDIETLDPQSHHLLSTLYPNLLRHGVEDAQMSRLKGVYRRTWYVNQLLARSFVQVLHRLQEEEISPLVIGEMGLVSTIYPDYGYRPLYRLDLLVPYSQTLAAINTLEELGWTNSYRPQPGDRFGKNPLPLWRVTSPNDPLCVPIYLHNHLFSAKPQSYTDEKLWTDAISTEIGNFPAIVLSPIDQLLHLSLQNNREGKQRPIYWLADASLLVQALSEESDWVKLVTQAQRYEIVLPLRYLLKELGEVLNLSFPDWVLPSLNQMAIAYSELLEYNLAGDRKLLLLKAQLLRLRQGLKRLFVGDFPG